MRRNLVSFCLADSTQQIHSLRASGVMSFQVAIQLSLDISSLCRSSGNLCIAPSLIFFGATIFIFMLLRVEFLEQPFSASTALKANSVRPKDLGENSDELSPKVQRLSLSAASSTEALAECRA